MSRVCTFVLRIPYQGPSFTSRSFSSRPPFSQNSSFCPHGPRSTHLRTLTAEKKILDLCQPQIAQQSSTHSSYFTHYEKKASQWMTIDPSNFNQTNMSMVRRSFHATPQVMRPRDEEDDDPENDVAPGYDKSTEEELLAEAEVWRKKWNDPGKVNEQNSDAVNWALAANVVILIVKAVTTYSTRSDTMIGSTLHSIADVGNQVLLKYGLVRSRKRPSQRFPHGHTREVYVWSLVSACGIFFIGAGVSVYEGIIGLMEGQNTGHLEAGLCLKVLVPCAMLEAWSLYVAYKAVKAGADDAGMSLWQYGKTGPNPFGLAVLLEDSASLVSLFVAMSCLSLQYTFDSPVFDSLGSILIGGIQAGVASFLIWKNTQSLIGRSIPRVRKTMVVDLLRRDPVVKYVHGFVAELNGIDTVHVHVNIDFDGLEVTRKYLQRHPHIAEEYSKLRSQTSPTSKDNAFNSERVQEFFKNFGDGVVEQVAQETDRLEHFIRLLIPEAKYIHIETH